MASRGAPVPGFPQEGPPGLSISFLLGWGRGTARGLAWQLTGIDQLAQPKAHPSGHRVPQVVKTVLEVPQAKFHGAWSVQFKEISFVGRSCLPWGQLMGLSKAGGGFFLGGLTCVNFRRGKDSAPDLGTF